LNASWRMHISWLVLVLGGLWGISVARAAGSNTNVVATALLYGYLTWALYWGGPAFLGWWRSTFLRFSGSIAAFAPAGCGFQIGLAFLVLFLVGIPFCALGGGIYQFSRHWKTARYHV
jgi:hypothetical protein